MPDASCWVTCNGALSCPTARASSRRCAQGEQTRRCAEARQVRCYHQSVEAASEHLPVLDTMTQARKARLELVLVL